MPMLEHEYVRSKKVAELCGVSVRTIHYWAKNKNLPHHETEGGHLRFDLIKVMTWYKEKNISVPPKLKEACD